MNAYVNYVVEANAALILFLGAYLLILRRETDFKIQRAFLLFGILMSLTFPLLHVQWNGPSIPAISRVMSSYFLHEVVVVAEGNIAASTASTSWVTTINFIQIVYAVGVSFFIIRFFVWLLSLVILVRQSKPTAYGTLTVIESPKSIPAFSFFNCIVIGRADTLSVKEKNDIIRHEIVHAHQFHSFDILLINLLAIFFWFNPLLKIYKKIFVQLHEFEADARAVENRDVNEYCSLLAKVALESAGFKLANHFSKSLTLKRIEMMRTIKKKIRPWKMAVATGIVPVAFFVIACQDQIANEVADIAKSSSMAIDIPAEVQQKYDELSLASPDKKFLLMETDENMKPKLDAMTKKFESLSQSQIGHIELITPPANPSEEPRTFAIIEYTDQADQIGDRAKLDGDVYTFVEETAKPKDGMRAFYEHIARKLRYPAQARRLGIEGLVFVEFVIQTDGSISDVKIKKGIGGGCDQEAMNVIKSSPRWVPGKNKGVAVKQQLVLPISFKLAGSKSKDEAKAPTEALQETVVVGNPEN
jgi:TonB family protein